MLHRLLPNNPSSTSPNTVLCCYIGRKAVGMVHVTAIARIGPLVTRNVPGISTIYLGDPADCAFNY